MDRRLRHLLPALLTAAAVGAVAAPGTQAATAAPVLQASVGPSHTISLRTSGGVAVRNLVAGRPYTIVVRDRSDLHNFRLLGAGVAKSTTVAQVATVRWTVTFRPGTYTYRCDPHATTMRGSFTAKAPAAA